MKRLLYLCIALTLTPSLVVAGGVRLRYEIGRAHV